jgi:hypothetical protein
MNEFEITTSPIQGPYFGILYGPPGCGKTWLCRHAPTPFYLAVEKGVEKVPDVGRFTKDGRINLPEDIETFFKMMMFFITSKHDYQTIVIDSGKFIDALVEHDVIVKNPVEIIKKEEVKVNCIGDYVFGRGFEKALAYYARFLKGVDALHKKGINVILIAHSKEKTTSNASGDDFKKHCIDMLEFGRISVPNLLSARADFVYFMRSEAQTGKKINPFGGVAKTVALKDGQPEILVYTRSTNSFDAKVRTEKVENIPDYYLIDINNNETSKQIFLDLEK